MEESAIKHCCRPMTLSQLQPRLLLQPQPLRPQQVSDICFSKLHC